MKQLRALAAMPQPPERTELVPFHVLVQFSGTDGVKSALDRLKGLISEFRGDGR